MTERAKWPSRFWFPWLTFRRHSSGIEQARIGVLETAGTFVDALSPIKEDIDDQRKLKLALDGLQIELTAAVSTSMSRTFTAGGYQCTCTTLEPCADETLCLQMAPFFHVALMRTNFWTKNEHAFGTTVDVSYGVLGGSMAFVKDAMESMSTLPVCLDIPAVCAKILMYRRCKTMSSPISATLHRNGSGLSATGQRTC